MDGVTVGPMDSPGTPLLGPPSLQSGQDMGTIEAVTGLWGRGRPWALLGSLTHCSPDTRLCRTSHPQRTGLGVLRGRRSGKKGTGGL